MQKPDGTMSTFTHQSELGTPVSLAAFTTE
jgi:hypothetical protein